MNISALNHTTPADWFALGSAVFEGRAAGPDRYPPLNDMPAQRGWLAGFGASWIEAAERHDRDPARYPPTLDLGAHLTRALTDRPDRLRQLGAYRRGTQVGAITETGENGVILSHRHILHLRPTPTPTAHTAVPHPPSLS